MRALIAALCRRLPGWLIRGLLHAANPHFIVSAAGIFRNGAGEVLLLRHVVRGSYPWGLPGGFLKAGETPEQGAVRELTEETGLVAGAAGIVGVNMISPRHMEMIVLGATAVEMPSRLDFEIFEARFFAVNRLPEDMPPGHRRVVLEIANKSC
ncbi:MAG: NUDIX domain-containing protein [Rhodospirillaceae bacterium]|nr:NUDIX domain-containing protein [Rhodospirillaceae bacterium]